MTRKALSLGIMGALAAASMTLAPTAASARDHGMTGAAHPAGMIMGRRPR